MQRKLAEELGPRLTKGLELWREVKELGVDVDDTSDYPEAVHLILPDLPSERASFIFDDDELSTSLSFFVSAKYGTFNVCFHSADCECGYTPRRVAMHA